jgi:hypothetical protein
MKFVTIAILALLGATAALAAELDLGLWTGASTETPAALWIKTLTGFNASAGKLQVLGHLGVRTDGSYGGFLGGNYGYGGISFETIDGGLLYSGDSVSVSLGKLEMRDIVDSPYSLFLSGRGNRALNASLELRSGAFFYNDRWIALSYDLENTREGAAWDWPDRSAVVKSWGVEFGSFRVALQDIAVFAAASSGSNPLFDLEYFAYPIPSFYVQYLRFGEEGPGLKKMRDDNSMTGIMVDWTGEGWYAVGQILVDDINMNRFLNPGGRQNPDKIAWELGLRHETEIGTFGLYHAGATKYTFEPYGNGSENSMYGYAFYPDVEYEVDSTPMALEPEDNYVGYLHGENNLALMGTWRDSFGSIAAAASLEFTLSGSKSPANPWGEYLTWKEGGSGTKLFGEDRLEKKLLIGGSIGMPAGPFEVGVEVKLGWVWNRLELAAAPGSASDDGLNSLRIYRPSAHSAPIGELVLGAKYHVPK